MGLQMRFKAFLNYFCHRRRRTAPRIFGQKSTQNRHSRCRGVAKCKNRVPTQGEKHYFLCFSPSVGSPVLQFATPPERERVSKTTLSLGRCCKNQKLRSHAGREGRKNYAPAQRGNAILHFCNTSRARALFLRGKNEVDHAGTSFQGLNFYKIRNKV